MQRSHKKTLIVRSAITASLFFAGFSFPLLWIVAAFFAYATSTAIPEPKPITPEDMWKPRQSTITVDHPDWLESFLGNCESPAETGFLEAMVEGYKLIPQNGILVGPDIELDMQVAYSPYRLDFLVNKWLVVEVDGAAWHSAPEHIERDRIRDEFFAAKGFSVLRIPAKTVFNAPNRAVEMVRDAVARGRPSILPKAVPPPPTIGKLFKDSVKTVSNMLVEIEQHVEEARAVQQAMIAPNRTFSTEKLVINSALDSAEAAVELELRRAANPSSFDYFDAEYERLEKLLRDSDAKSGLKVDGAPKFTILPIIKPAPHPELKINAAIMLAYDRFTADRTQFFNEARAKMLKDPSLKSHVQEHLESFGCRSVWLELELKSAFY